MVAEDIAFIMYDMAMGDTQQATLDDAVLYPNPYMVVTSQGYTKHYYAGTERLATAIGQGGLDTMIHPIGPLSQSDVNGFHKPFLEYYSQGDPFKYHHALSEPMLTWDIDGQFQNELLYQCDPLELDRMDISFNRNILLSSITSYAHYNGIESDIYFYHSDHLGSASWITDSSSVPIQYIHYAPYGELLANQAPYSYDERFKFTGKERDSETGYDYFGARYYWSTLGYWLSVDPLAGKYPNISPYAYCHWNPIGFVDPDGEDSRMVIYGNTINISAKYYAQSKDMRSLQQAIGFWNNQEGLKYVDKNGTTYSVHFDLKAFQSNNPRNDVALNNDKSSNSYEIVSSIDFPTETPNAVVTGLTTNNTYVQVVKSNAEGLTGPHEIGHTLMNANKQEYEHTQQGIMTKSGTDSQRSSSVRQETIDMIINSHDNNPNNKSLWQKIVSFFE